jgi:aminoglycoside phosphotransferase family enzyme/predicted kinase
MNKPAPDRTLIDGLRRHLAARGDAVELIETHISWVLLAGDDAYKLKKPVRLGFLDFGTPAARQHFCAEELRLNCRLAPALYLDVLPVRGTPGAPHIGGRGPLLDHVLHMRRFPAGALLSERLAAGELQPQDIDRLAERIAAFHDAAPPAQADGPWGTPEGVAAATRGVLARLAEDSPLPAPLTGWIDAELSRLAPLWQQRLRGGRVREGHGDLHLANTLRLPDGEVTAFDCIEFDPALRWIDVIDDAGFLVMDLLAHGRQDLAWRFLNGWLDATGDHAGLAVLRPYLVHRALVRTLVGRLRPVPPPAGSPDYLALAQRLAEPGPARLLLAHGLSGSGKSHAAVRLAEAAGAVRVRSDVERKRLFGLGPLARSAEQVPGGIYGPCATARTYDQLLQAARTALQAGWSVIVDAAFLRRCERDRFHALAFDLRVPFALLDCQAPLAVLRERVAARTQRGDDPSEADLAVLEAQRDFAEPLADDEQRAALTLRTDQPWDAATLAARWAALSG